MAAAVKNSRTGLWFVGIVWLISLVSWLFATLLLLEQHPTEADTLGNSSAYSAFWASVFFTLLAFALTCFFLLRYVNTLRNNGEIIVSVLRRMQASDTQRQALLTQLGENLLLSDTVKSVVFRERDLSLLRDAIQQDIRAEKWDSANVLIDELHERFGCKEEAQEIRDELDRYQIAGVEEKIDTSVKHIESLWSIHSYVDAQKEVDNLTRLYPNNEKVHKLEGKTAQLRQEHKKDLLRRLDAVVKNNDYDQGVELLKLLDIYLTPTEAAALEESARGVLRGKLHNMGVQFSMFVTEKQWDKALQIGKCIIEEYPNSKMSQEVRDNLETLEQRVRESVG